MKKSIILAAVMAALGLVGVLRAAQQPGQAPSGCCDGGSCCFVGSPCCVAK